MRWSMSMCLDCSWWAGFEARLIADLLSQNNIIEGTSTSKWRSNLLNQTISLITEDKTRYSASVDDFEIVGCFLERQEKRLFPKKTQKPEVDLLVSTQLVRPNQYPQRQWGWESSEQGKTNLVQEQIWYTAEDDEQHVGEEL